MSDDCRMIEAFTNPFNFFMFAVLLMVLKYEKSMAFLRLYTPNLPLHLFELCLLVLLLRLTMSV